MSRKGDDINASDKFRLVGDKVTSSTAIKPEMKEIFSRQRFYNRDPDQENWDSDWPDDMKKDYVWKNWTKNLQIMKDLFNSDQHQDDRDSWYDQIKIAYGLSYDHPPPHNPQEEYFSQTAHQKAIALLSSEIEDIDLVESQPDSSVTALFSVLFGIEQGWIKHDARQLPAPWLSGDWLSLLDKYSSIFQNKAKKAVEIKFYEVKILLTSPRRPIRAELINGTNSYIQPRAILHLRTEGEFEAKYKKDYLSNFPDEENHRALLELRTPHDEYSSASNEEVEVNFGDWRLYWWECKDEQKIIVRDGRRSD